MHDSDRAWRIQKTVMLTIIVIMVVFLARAVYRVMNFLLPEYAIWATIGLFLVIVVPIVVMNIINMRKKDE